MRKLAKSLTAIAFLLAMVLTADATAESISGTVWLGGDDPDCGSEAAPGPNRVEGIEISLCREDGSAIINPLDGQPLVTTTDADGAYSFKSLANTAPGVDVFLVKVTGDAPAGTTLGSINCLNTEYLTEADGKCVATGNPLPSVCGDRNLAESSIVILMPDLATDSCNTIVEGIDFVYCEEPPPPCTGKIGDQVWIDLNGDCIKDAGEEGIEGVRVILLDANGNPLAETETDAAGTYFFEGLCAGSYRVVLDPETIPDGLEAGPCSLGTNNCDGADVVLDADDTIYLDADFCFKIPPPPPPGGDGCTPGYWRQCQHLGNWGIDPRTPFGDVFADAFPGATLWQVVRARGGGLNALGRHAVAAYLNALRSDVEYDLSADEIVEIFNDAIAAGPDAYEGAKNIFAAFNEQDCPLARADLPEDADEGLKALCERRNSPRQGRCRLR